MAMSRLVPLLEFNRYCRMSKKKKRRPTPARRCEPAATAGPEDEEDYSELEKKAAAMYGVDIEAERRLSKPRPSAYRAAV
jgi:hypothetical protein